MELTSIGGNASSILGMLFPAIPQFTISGAPKRVKHRALRSRVTASISMRSLIPELPGALEPAAMKGCAFPA